MDKWLEDADKKAEPLFEMQFTLFLSGAVEGWNSMPWLWPRNGHGLSSLPSLEMVRNEAGDTDWKRLLLLLLVSAPPGVRVPMLWVPMLWVRLLR